MNDAKQIQSALASARTIAVVGCSPNPDRPSNAIARYLREQGYRVIPVNPGHRQILGEACFRSLLEIPADVKIDIVDVFRRSDQVAPVSFSCSRGWSTPIRRDGWRPPGSRSPWTAASSSSMPPGASAGGISTGLASVDSLPGGLSGPSVGVFPRLD